LGMWRHKQISIRAMFIQGDRNFSMHLMITVQKHAKLILKVSITYHDNVVNILNTVFENTVRHVNKYLETGGGHFDHYL
jgi:hypothetical protein